MIEVNSLLTMLESSYDGIWITDGCGKVLYANSANATLLGVSPSYLVGKTTQQCLDEKLFSNSAILEAIKEKRQCSQVSYNYHTECTVLATATPIFGKDGHIEYIFNNVRDTTALVNMQSSLQNKEEIIRRQNQELQSMKIRLGLSTIVANSKAFLDVVALSQHVAAFDGSTVLITGESGTGKELIAELVVKNSPRKSAPYFQLNCGAIPESLIESELFGYEKGAFTGANSNGHKGLFETASGGTLLLDEVGDMPMIVQVKLLRALQQRKIVRIGSTAPIDVDVRVIAATNKNLEEMVQKGTFREDLFYRLNVIPINVPPLRQRKEDIVPLLQHFLSFENQKYGLQKAISPEALYLLEQYSWPGNVRELENLVENLVVISPLDIIGCDSLPARMRPNAPSADVCMTAPAPSSLRDIVEQSERAAIENALQKYGSIRKAASALDVNPSTLVRKLRSYRA